MKKALAIIAIGVYALSFASCKKCYDCTITILGIESTSEVCTAKKSDIDDLEAVGWTCTKQ